MNPFEALCRFASDERWCRDVHCSCEHLQFRYAFSEIIAGNSPEDVFWLTDAKRTRDWGQGRIPRRFSDEQRETFLKICLSANILQIASDCKFPDWLSFLGLVIRHMGSDTHTFRLVSSVWAVQLKEIVSADADIYARLADVAENYSALLTLADLMKCESNVQYRYRLDGIDRGLDF